MDHSYEEVRAAAIALLAGREKTGYELNQYQNLQIGVAEVFARREGPAVPSRSFYGGSGATLSQNDEESFLEVFWTLFREGIITLGLNDSNRQFPFFRVSRLGQRVISGQDPYFFQDVAGYEKILRSEVPAIDAVTLIYLKEALQSFRTGCVLAATVMLGVATEHTFLLLMEIIDQNQTYATKFASISQQRSILQKVNKFKAILDQELKNIPPEIKEDIDTHFAGVLSIIRNFRNQSGHPTGKIIDREQAYILLQLFVPYCRKMYQLMDFYK